ncbi:hypothetical protein FOCC_FOCC007047 [Frankliniella occidentalis]|nr:hypothetical protein FOCC_FOCC007047 [Frankliniella occidentalis]
MSSFISRTCSRSDLTRHDGAALNMNLTFYNMRISDITHNVVMHSLKFDVDNLEMDIRFSRPQVNFRGTYKTDGKILWLPVWGSGPFQMHMGTVFERYRIKGERRVGPDGQAYMHIVDYASTLEPRQMSLDFQNLFNGNWLLASWVPGALPRPQHRAVVPARPRAQRPHGLHHAASALRSPRGELRSGPLPQNAPPMSAGRRGASSAACLLVVHALALISLVPGGLAVYLLGTGIADVTGPAAEVPFMGYASPSQKGQGIHTRQFSRAFIFQDAAGERLAFVCVDVGMIGSGVRKEVLKRLAPLGGYTDNTLMLSGTHTHSAPGGFLMHLLFDITTMGFVKESFDGLVEGITLVSITEYTVHSTLPDNITHTFCFLGRRDNNENKIRELGKRGEGRLHGMLVGQAFA